MKDILLLKKFNSAFMKVAMNIISLLNHSQLQHLTPILYNNAINVVTVLIINLLTLITMILI
jgi:hypothetical protein